MRTTLRLMTAFLLFLVLAAPEVLADDGTVIVKIHQAAVKKPNNDAVGSEQQDLYVMSSIDFSPILISAAAKSNRDDANWSPPGYNDKLVPGKNQRYFDIYFELWDNDTGCWNCGDDEDFDISPQQGNPPPLFNGVRVPGAYLNIPTGGFPHVQYDVCTGGLEVKGINAPWIQLGTNGAVLNGENTTSGTLDNWAKLKFEVERQPSNWLPDDVGIAKVEIVQSVYDAMHAVVDKETSLIVRISSTYPGPLPNVLVSGQLSDGITTVFDSRTVTILGGSPSQPGETLVALFDGSTAQPYRPQKVMGVGTGKVSGSARIHYQESISPNAPPQLQDCANQNNHLSATDLPLVHTSDLKTVYQPFDYAEDLNFITSQQLQAMYAREEPYRLSSWPLARLDSSMSFSQSSWNHGSGSFCPFEPICALIYANKTASIANIDKWVLAVRAGWFSQNAFRHQFISSSSIGYSLGTFAPRAVLAEDGRFGVAVHELGHSYALSQQTCSNGGLFNICFDEYNHTNPPETNPYEARGYDVRAGAVPSQAIYPGGYNGLNHWPGIDCPSTAPQGRDICAANFMDSTPPMGYRNWIDAYSFDYLIEHQLPAVDPFLVNVTGLIHLPQGEGSAASPPIITGTLGSSLYQFWGVEDMSEPPLSPSGEGFTGLGPFRIRLVTPAGVRDYRFVPRMFDDPPAPDLAGGFSINVPWDPMTTEIQLLGPSNLWDTFCWGNLCPGDGVVLDSRPVTTMPPQAWGLRAGLDAPAPVPGPGEPQVAPIIGPGHTAVVSWEASDADSPMLQSALILVMNEAGGGATGVPTPIAIDIDGGSISIPHERLAGAPGTYAGRLLVSDGVNTAEIFQGPLFTICNLSNGGEEVCNGIDDDCNGVVDDGAAPGPVDDVMLNPQPLPPGDGPDLLQWAADPAAQSYDVVFGDLGVLHGTAGFTDAVLGCLAEDTAGASLEVPQDPLPGQALFYLVRSSSCFGPGTWNEKNPGPSQMDRDPGINASPASCRP